MFAAHYDTKTDLLDHLERAPAELLAVLVVPLMLAGALAGLWSGRSSWRQALLRRITSVAAWAGLGYGAVLFTTLSAGAFVPARSPGALDDGASCAVLVRHRPTKTTSALSTICSRVRSLTRIANPSSGILNRRNTTVDTTIFSIDTSSQTRISLALIFR